MRILTLGIKDTINFDLINRDLIIDEGLNKPSRGVLYGSTLKKMPGGMIDSSWNRFVDIEINDMFNVKYGVSFTLYKNSKILTIDSPDDYIRCMEIYKKTWCGKSDRFCLDFYKIALDFDAFHLTENGFWSLRLPFGNNSISQFHYQDFYSYDVETWIILNPKCINKGSILNHNNIYKRKEGDEYDD